MTNIAMPTTMKTPPIITMLEPTGIVASYSSSIFFRKITMHRRVPTHMLPLSKVSPIANDAAEKPLKGKASRAPHPMARVSKAPRWTYWSGSLKS
jgi:hypothetical protein